MRIATIIILTCLLVSTSRGETGPLRELMSSSSATSTAQTTPQTSAPQGQEAPRLMADLADQGQDKDQVLELPSSDYFTLDSSSRNDQFQLKIPDDLPESDIPLTMNDKVVYFINNFQTKGREVFARWLSRSERYVPMMKEVLKKEGLPEDLVYLAMIESGFSPHAYSSARAVGPWQFMSQTARGYSLRIDPWIDERRDPLKSTAAAAMYLKELYTLFDKDWYLAAAGYNAGENKILRAINKYNSRDFWQLSQGSYLKPETKDYVPKLLAAAIIAKDPAKYGFSDVAYLPTVEFDTVQVPKRMDLEVAANLCGVKVDSIRQLNPELLLWCTPPNYPNYELKIPKGKKEIFLTELAKYPQQKLFSEKVIYTRYRAKKRDSLASIARKFGISREELVEANGSSLGHRKKLAGTLLLVPVQVASLEPASHATDEVETRPKSFNKYYTVKKGDTLGGVARRFNVSARLIAAWNNLKGKALKPGKKIIVARYVEKKGALVYERDDG